MCPVSKGCKCNTRLRHDPQSLKGDGNRHSSKSRRGKGGSKGEAAKSQPSGSAWHMHSPVSSCTERGRPISRRTYSICRSKCYMHETTVPTVPVLKLDEQA